MERNKAAINFMNQILKEEGVAKRAAKRHLAMGDWTGDRNIIAIAHPVSLKQYYILMNSHGEAISMLPKATYINLYR